MLLSTSALIIDLATPGSAGVPPALCPMAGGDARAPRKPKHAYPGRNADQGLDLELGVGLEIFVDGGLGVVTWTPRAVGKHVGRACLR